MSADDGAVRSKTFKHEDSRIEKSSMSTSTSMSTPTPTPTSTSTSASTSTSTTYVPPVAQSAPGILHFVPPNLSCFELGITGKGTGTNTLLWIGGLMDTYFSVSYPLALSKALPDNWSLILACLSSSGLQFGVRSINSDVDDLVKIIGYIKACRPDGKIVLMGHSTGCQDCAAYARATSSADVEGIILQAPVSDRQAIELFLPDATLQAVNRKAAEWSREGHGNEVLPNSMTNGIFINAPITAKRWLDLASPGPDHAGADDMFSSDLSEDRLEKVFTGGRSWLILQSGQDEFVPQHVDRASLVAKWKNIIESKCGGHVDKRSGVVPGASHNLNGNDSAVVQNLVDRVLGYISTF